MNVMKMGLCVWMGWMGSVYVCGWVGGYVEMGAWATKGDETYLMDLGQASHAIKK